MTLCSATSMMLSAMHVARRATSRGHAEAGRSAQGRSQPVHRTEEEALTETQEYMKYLPQEPAAKPLKARVKAEDHNLVMEVDTGDSVTVVSEATLGCIWVVQPAPPLQPTTARLRTYTGEEIPVIRKLTVKVRYQVQEEELPLLVVAGDGPSLLGRGWLS